MKERNATFLMLLAAILWGSTFVAQSSASDIITPFLYNGLRFFVGSVVLLPFSIKVLRRHKGDKEYMKNLLKGGLLTGFFIAAASYTQQYGIGFTQAGKAGFITSLYTLFVPIFSIALGKKVSFRTWVCVVIGIIGAFILSVNSNEPINKGDIWIFSCAILFAFQIMSIDIFGQKLEGIDLSNAQFLFGSIFSLILCPFFEPISFTVIKQAAFPILYAGIFSCGIAYSLQIIGQKYVPAAKATLSLSTESAWAAIGAFLILGERMTPKELCGCLLLFSAVIISQLPSKHSSS